MIGVRVRANCCCMLLDKGGKQKTKTILSFLVFQISFIFIFIFLIKKINKKSENGLTRNRVIRVAGSTDGWSGLSRVLQIIGFSGWIGPVPVSIPSFSGWSVRF